MLEQGIVDRYGRSGVNIKKYGTVLRRKEVEKKRGVGGKVRSKREAAAE